MDNLNITIEMKRASGILQNSKRVSAGLRNLASLGKDIMSTLFSPSK